MTPRPPAEPEHPTGDEAFAAFELLTADPERLTAFELAEHLLALEGLRDRLDASWLRLGARWDAVEAWAGDGALCGADWLRNRVGMGSRRARARLGVARRLGSMPVVAAAVDAGELSFEKTALLAAVRTTATAELFARDEPLLVDLARRHDADQLRAILAHWKARADETGFESDHDRLVAARRASVSETLDGVVKIDAVLDPESGALFKRAFDQIDDEFRRADRTDLANGVPARTPAQRHADALTELARRAAGATGHGRRPEAVVVLDHDTLTAEAGGVAHLDNGVPITGEAARRIACDAGITRVVTNGASEILDLGRTTPTVSTAQRRAVAVRDGGCTFAGCSVPAHRCEAHHIVPFRRGRHSGGSTDLANLTLLCRRHHHLAHEGGYRIGRTRGGHVRTRRPDGSPIPTRPRAGPLDPEGRGP